MAKKIYFTYNENGQLLDRDGTAEFLFQKKGIFVTEDIHRVKLFFQLNDRAVQAWDYNTEEDRIILKNGYEVGIANEIFDITGDFVSQKEINERFKKKERFSWVKKFNFLKSESIHPKRLVLREPSVNEEMEPESDDYLIYNHLVGSINTLMNEFNKKQARSSEEIQQLKASLKQTKNEKDILLRQLETAYYELIDLQSILKNRGSDKEKGRTVELVANKIKLTLPLVAHKKNEGEPPEGQV